MATMIQQLRASWTTLLIIIVCFQQAAAAAAAASEKADRNSNSNTSSDLNVTELDCRMRVLAYWHAQYLQPWRRLDNDDPTFSHVRDALRLDEQCPGFLPQQEEDESIQQRQQERKEERKEDEDPCATKRCIFVDPWSPVSGDNTMKARDGSRERPLLTASAALDLSRRAASAYNTTIVFRQGIHFLSETLELDERDNGLTLTTLPGEEAWLSGGIEIPEDTPWHWDCSLNLKVRVANLTDLLRDFTTLPKVPSLFAANNRLVRARFPNANPEINQWGYNTPDKLKYSIAADQVLEWHKPPPNGTVPTFTYIDLRKHDPTGRPIKNDSTMAHYNVYASGSGGVCADLWGADANSYWCSNASAGGWAEVDREAALSGSLQIPVGMTYNATNAIGRRLRSWTAATALGGLVHAWHSQSWAMHMFEISGVNHGNDGDDSNVTGQFHFAPGGGRQGGRNWCRCDQCTYAGRPWCEQYHSNNSTDDRLISGTWMVEHVLAELDAPGEFYFNGTSRQLYVYPNDTSVDDDRGGDGTDGAKGVGDPMAGLRNLRLALLERLVQIQGARDVTISGLGFRDSAATFMGSWSAPSGGDWSLHRGGALFVEDAERIVVRNCVFRRLDGNALFLSRRTRSVTISRNSFEWLGESAIATWGETQDFDGLAANFPLGTLIEGNTMRELGIYEKQSSGVGHNKAAQTAIRNNIIFNVPRAAINFNDMLGGGDVVENNLIFNSCRESGDHGPINSWDRQPFLTDLRNGTPSFVPIRRTIFSNLIFANYGASQGVDNDDGSSWYHIHHNVFYDADGFKMDYGGHDSLFEDNLVIRYPWKPTQSRPCVDLGGTFLPGNSHVIRRNTCMVPTDQVPIIQLENCRETSALLYDNQYMVSNANASVACGYQDSPIPFAKFQTLYKNELGSTVQPTPKSATKIIEMVSAVLYPEQTPVRDAHGSDTSWSTGRRLDSIQNLQNTLFDTLCKAPLFRLTGYCGWNYECAAVIYALRFDEKLELHLFQEGVKEYASTFLDAAAKFPYPGSRPFLGPWLYSPGDRMGLFGSLYFGRPGYESENIATAVQWRLKHWSRSLGCFTRWVGWGFLWGFCVVPVWIWADDAFIGGFPLVHFDPQAFGEMLLKYDALLRDKTDNLYWHGAKVLWFGYVEYNGVKWGRANGWMLLAFSSFMIETTTKDDESIATLRNEISKLHSLMLESLLQYQRSTGAFGNVIDSASSPDELSLTAIYVFSAGVASVMGPDPSSSQVTATAERAWMWLEKRTVDGLAVSDTCGGQHLGTAIDFYDKNVGLSQGPGPALLLYARLGAALLGFL